jgi:hypothetical protein
MRYLPKRATLVGNVAIHFIQLRMYPHIEDVGSELHLPSLGEFGFLGEAQVPVIDSGTAADRPGALPIVPRATVGFVNKFGSKAQLEMLWAKGPVKAAQTVCLSSKGL